MENERKRPVVQFKEPCEEAKPDEDCKIEVDGEAGRCKKLNMRMNDTSKKVAARVCANRTETE